MPQVRPTLFWIWLLGGCLLAPHNLAAQVPGNARFEKEDKPKIEDVEPEKVRTAIKRAIAYLREQQQRDGSFPSLGQYTIGATGICTLALIEAGVELEDPAIRRALDVIRSGRSDWTYDIALQTMVLCRAGAPADIPLIGRNVQWLERAQKTEGLDRGAWGYQQGSAGSDNSNTQFALLALYDAQQAGVPVNQETWKQSLLYWERSKNADGSWNYMRRQSPTGSMTSAGISSVLIASASINADDARADASGCQCIEQQHNATVENAMRWLADHFKVAMNPGTNSEDHRIYYLYGLERACRLSGTRFLVPSNPTEKNPPRDWYREGTNELVRVQKQNGFWDGQGVGENQKYIATSLALLFLSKGRRPVLVSKLQRVGEDWNLLRHDLAHLTAYAEKQWKMPLTWQVVDGLTATVDDYAQAPVLFISGGNALRMTDNQKQVLKAYVEQGGFVFADACCAGGAFEMSFRELMAELFPDPHLRLRPLDVDHPIWTMEEKVNAKFLNPQTRWLYGIDVGCRTSVVLSNGNLSCYWEMDRARRTPPLEGAVAEDVAAARAMGINVLAYASNKQLKSKEQIPRES